MRAQSGTFLFFAFTAAAPAAAFAGELVGSRDPAAIYGGAAVDACGWPTTVFVNDCTGTLVHPSVVVLAAHCIAFGGQPTQVLLGDDYNQPTRTVGVAGCTAHPDWQDVEPGDGASDIAVCKLAEPIDNVQIVPILMGCETEALAVGATVTLVGYGDGDDALGHGPKREAVTAIQQVGTDAVWIGGQGKSSCYGDSGGPAYVQLADGSWRVFGATSGSATEVEGCGQTSIWTLVHVYVPWIEETTGIDVTPCHDADGTWNPGDGCMGFPLSPGSSGGTWADGCAGEVSGVVETCGPGVAGGTSSGGEDVDSTGDASPGETGDGDEQGDGSTADPATGGSGDEGTSSGQDLSGSAGEGAPAGCGCATANGRSATWAVLVLTALGCGRRARSGTVGHIDGEGECRI